MVRVLVLLCACSALIAAPPDALGSATPAPQRAQQFESEGYVPPVDAPVIDTFRPPDQPWLPGNRGLEYDTEPGQVVRASASGTVTFAGQVGGQLFVTVRHADGLRTTVGYVAAVLVATGDTVVEGERVALAADSIHFTARRGDRYIDPESLFWGVRIVVRLMPGPR